MMHSKCSPDGRQTGLRRQYMSKSPAAHTVSRPPSRLMSGDVSASRRRVSVSLTAEEVSIGTHATFLYGATMPIASPPLNVLPTLMLRYGRRAAAIYHFCHRSILIIDIFIIPQVEEAPLQIDEYATRTGSDRRDGEVLTPLLRRFLLKTRSFVIVVSARKPTS